MLTELDDGNWSEVFGESDNSYGPQNSLEDVPVRIVTDDGPVETTDDPVTREDVVEILSMWQNFEGTYCEWGGVVLVRLENGRFGLFGGECDTTGWGCRDSAYRFTADAVSALARWAASDEDRRLLGLTLEGVLCPTT
jgi:hypothetical protein